jgi:threonine synthase
MYSIICRNCKIKLHETAQWVVCPHCKGSIGFEYNASSLRFDSNSQSMWRYRELLPVQESQEIVSLHEGYTPLEPAKSFPSGTVYLKNETINPTGSHKDRALSIGITKAVEFKRNAVMLYSDGSTALSSAAYAARAGIRTIVTVARSTPSYRLLPLIIYNADIVEYQGEAADALDWVHECCSALGLYETSTYRRANPYECEGPKTIGLEIVDQMGCSPDWIVVPVGGGGTLAGIWRGLVELDRLGVARNRTRMVGVLPVGFTALKTALEHSIRSENELWALAPAEPPATIQAKIAMSRPPDGLEAVEAVRDSGGLLLFVSDEEVLVAQRDLATREGIYAEPSGTAAYAGVKQLLQSGKVGLNESVVAVITGSGFRETTTVHDETGLQVIRVSAGDGFNVIQQILNRSKC